MALSDMLNDPDGSSHSELRKAILAYCSALRPEAARMFPNVGHLWDGKEPDGAVTPAWSYADKLAGEVIDGKRSYNLREIENSFYHDFDNHLIRYAHISRGARIEVVDYFSRAFVHLLLRDDLVKTGCLTMPERVTAYGDALYKWEQKAIEEYRSVQTTGIALFVKIYRGKCRDHSRRPGTLLRRFSDYLATLPNKISKHINIDRNSKSGKRLDRMQKLDLNCYEFLKQLYSDEGYTYADFVPEYGQTEEAVRQKAYRCRKKFRDNLSDS